MQLFLRWRVTHAGSRTPGTPGKRALAITQQPTSLRAQPKSPPLFTRWGTDGWAERSLARDSCIPGVLFKFAPRPILAG